MPKHIRTVMRAKGSHLFFLRSKYQTDDGNIKSYDVVCATLTYNPNRSRKDPDAVTIFVLNKDHSQMLITMNFAILSTIGLSQHPQGLLTQVKDLSKQPSVSFKKKQAILPFFDAKILPATYSSVGDE